VIYPTGGLTLVFALFARSSTGKRADTGSHQQMSAEVCHASTFILAEACQVQRQLYFFCRIDRNIATDTSIATIAIWLAGYDFWLSRGRIKPRLCRNLGQVMSQLKR
jgi:hypothetical protein